MDSPAAVRAELEAEKATVVDLLQYDGAGAVTEQDECRPVAPVEDAGQDVAADDERALRQSGRDHPVRLDERVDESRATGKQAVGRRTASPHVSQNVRTQRRERLG